MLFFLEELVLQAQADPIRLHGADHARDLIGPRLHVKFTQFAIGAGRIAGVVFGESRVPANAGEDARWQILALEVSGRFGSGPVKVYKIRTRDRHARSFSFARMSIVSGS